ncbi:MAG: rRNA maturation RNase YbeY [Hyphomicrobium sp.]
MDDGDIRTTETRQDAETAPEPEPAGRLMVELVEDDGDWSAFAPVEATVMAAARAVSDAPELALGHVEATVALSSDAIVRDLNRTYRQQDKPTNVLSFPAPALPAGAHAGASADRRPLGDVVLAAETVAQEAQALGISPTHHLQHLVVHGLLHLIGFDHLTDAQATEMESLETKLLARLGVADPYAEPAT